MACQTLAEYSGVSDPAIFDPLNQRLLRADVGPDVSGDTVDEISWCLKALASSGNLQYEPTLRAIATRPQYRGGSRQAATDMRILKHAKVALASLPKFARLNPIINSDRYLTPGRDERLARALSFVLSAEPDLYRAGLRDIKAFYPQELPALYDPLAENLRGLDVGAAEAAEDIPRLDGVGWACRTLGETGNMKYEPLLRQLWRNAETRKLKKGCKRGWEALIRINRGDRRPPAYVVQGSPAADASRTPDTDDGTAGEDEYPPP